MQKVLIRIFILCFVIFPFFSKAQSKTQDLASIATHIRSSDLPDHSYEKSTKKTKFIQAVNPLYWVMKGGLSFYQTHISSQLSASCIYEISCSRFSKKLFAEYGLVKGLFLTTDRMSKCNRISYSQANRLSLNDHGKIVEHVHDYSFKHVE